MILPRSAPVWGPPRKLCASERVPKGIIGHPCIMSTLLSVGIIIAEGRGTQLTRWIFRMCSRVSRRGSDAIARPQELWKLLRRGHRWQWQRQQWGGRSVAPFGERGGHGRGRAPHERLGPFVGPAALEANGIAVGASGGADGAPATTGTAGAALVAGVAGEEPPPKMRRGRPLGKAPHSCGHKDCLMLTLDQEQQKRYTCPAREVQRVAGLVGGGPPVMRNVSPGPMTRLGAVGGAVTEGPRRGRSASASSPLPAAKVPQQQAAALARWSRPGAFGVAPAGRREGCCSTDDGGCDHTLNDQVAALQAHVDQLKKEKDDLMEERARMREALKQRFEEFCEVRSNIGPLGVVSARS